MLNSVDILFETFNPKDASHKIFFETLCTFAHNGRILELLNPHMRPVPNIKLLFLSEDFKSGNLSLEFESDHTPPLPIYRYAVSRNGLWANLTFNTLFADKQGSYAGFSNICNKEFSQTIFEPLPPTIKELNTICEYFPFLDFVLGLNIYKNTKKSTGALEA